MRMQCLLHSLLRRIQQCIALTVRSDPSSSSLQIEPAAWTNFGQYPAIARWTPKETRRLGRGGWQLRRQSSSQFLNSAQHRTQ